MQPIEIVLLIAAGYALVGIISAVWFVTLGVGRADDVARGGTWGFRVLIFPGSAALWPVLAVMCMRARGGKVASS
jgi:hypothetical protein